MKRRGLWLVALAIIFATQSRAQQGSTPVRTNATALSKIAVSAEKDYKLNRGKALEMARQNGWVVQKTYADGTHISLQGIDTRGLPIYYITYNNTRAAATTRTDQLWAGGALGLSLSGSSSSVAEKLAIWDGGAIRATHQELRNRIIQKDNATEINDHATHVAGTMAAKGVNASAKGMAHGITKLQAYDFDNDVSEIAAAAKDLLVSNHSYGSITGWHFNDDRKGTKEDPNWEWWGDTGISTKEDYKFGYYDQTAAKWDQIAYNAPYLLMVKSAGNNRSENGPKEGEPYFQRNGSGKFELVASRGKDISSNNGYDIISTYGTAKNILTVGAVASITNGYAQASDVVAAGFSSFGPTDDGRIKPDLVGNGTSILSASSEGDKMYKITSGTSMSAPNVSGTLLLLQEHYANLNKGSIMRAATLKGLAIHTADEAGPAPGPDYQFGWGLLNAAKAATLLSNTNKTHLLQENTLQQGQVYTLKVTASGAGPLVATISWTDPESTVLEANASVLNNRSARLVNDLDISIQRESTTYLPWILDPTKPDAAAKPGNNILDNVEQILVSDAVPGETYTITIKHKGTLTKGPQNYSLLVSGVGGAAYCSSAPASEIGASIKKLTLGVSMISFPDACATYQNLTATTLTLTRGQANAMALELGSCGAAASKIAKVYVDWNNDGDFTDANEEAAVSGVILGDGTFNASITPPASVAVGDKTRMRVVVQESINAADVTSCGTYTRGETQDYVVQFAKPAVDIAVSTVSANGTSLCANPAQKVKVILRNEGTAAQQNIPVQVSIRRNGQELQKLTGTFTGSLAPNAQTEFVLDGSFATTAGEKYDLVATSGLVNDGFTANNQQQATFTVSANLAAPTDATAVRCGSATNYTLTGAGAGTLFWYTSLTDTMPVAAGNQAQVALSQTTGKLYAAYNDFRGTIGPKQKSFATGGGYNQFTPAVKLSAKAPMLLESARLYIGNSGNIRFTVYNAEGAPVSERTLAVTATRTTAGPGVQPNDPNDAGAVYYLGLEIPEAGEYQIAIAYENGATIFRNNEGVKGYPFGIPNVVSITGNTATETPLNFYYYFYDLQVTALGCKSDRTEAIMKSGTPVAKPVIAHQGTTLVSSAAEGNLWFLNNKLIANATGKVYTPTESGVYTVLVQLDGCISDVSQAFNFNLESSERNLGPELIASPNPSTGRFDLRLETSSTEDITFEVYDLLGKAIYTGSVEHNGQYQGTIDLSKRASGVYMLRAKHGSKTYSRKLVVQH
ncbi:S8 family serine peptidase [Pontibacter arcticus]|uniref:Peptidase S8 n=1 Tax=Pontibacter arcticus TaxID=2080288 RepID=A0A364RID5_9BACT|nr:S8 family serine peptidase [Pontibacter arcticus]RAU84110.1 peptidase S8 [Pontibacter arcticus]